jgi:hypothetical protein
MQSKAHLLVESVAGLATAINSFAKISDVKAAGRLANAIVNATTDSLVIDGETIDVINGIACIPESVDDNRKKEVTSKFFENVLRWNNEIKRIEPP